MFNCGFRFMAFVGFALLVSACDLFGSGEKKYSEVKNCTEDYDGPGEFRKRRYCVWNNSEKTLTVYRWKLSTGPSQVYRRTPPLNNSQIDRVKNTIEIIENTIKFGGTVIGKWTTRYELDFDI